eukprot:scaffold66958_cov49-Attheya_sp.AAC.2
MPRERPWGRGAWLVVDVDVDELILGLLLDREAGRSGRAAVVDSPSAPDKVVWASGSSLRVRLRASNK